MRSLRRAESALTAAEGALITALLGFMVLFAFLQVLLRAGWSTGLLWADTLNRHLVLWVGFLGACIAAAQNRQFAMDAAGRVLRGRAKILAALAGHLFTAAVSAALARASLKVLQDEFRHGSALFAVGPFQAPRWAVLVIVPAGFALLAAHYLLRAALAASGDAGGDPDEGRPPRAAGPGSGPPPKAATA